MQDRTLQNLLRTQQSKKAKKKGKSSGKNKHKVGRYKSPYRLYVEFYPEFWTHRKEFNYFSNYKNGVETGLSQLKWGVLFSKCKGRYKRAMLFRQSDEKCLSVWLPGQPEMTYEEYGRFLAAQYKPKPSLLHAYVVFKPHYARKLRAAGKRHPLYLFSRDIDLHFGLKGYDLAFYSLIQMLTAGKYRGHYQHATIYKKNTGNKVATVDERGLVTIVNRQFREWIDNSEDFRLSDGGVFVGEITEIELELMIRETEAKEGIQSPPLPEWMAKQLGTKVENHSLYHWD